MRSPTKEEAKVELGPTGKRLDGWKDVASHLGRGERTVKRWDVERGLPIHRVPGAGRATIYAYTAELDEWLKSRVAQDQETAPKATQEATQEAEDAAGPTSAEESGVILQDNLFESVTPPMEAQPVRNGPRRSWTLALAGLILAVVAGAGGRMAALHHRGLSNSKAASPQAPTGRSATGAEVSQVSNSDKRQAHELYLKGRYEWNQRTPESLNRALDAFTQAAVRDPYNAESYVGLADTYNLLQIYATLPLTDSFPRAIAAARRAVQLDDSLAEAHRALAFAEFYGAADYAESEKEFRRAIQLNPNDPVTRRWYGNAFAMPGRYEESLAQFDKAQELDPSSHSTLSDKGIILYNMGRREEGMALLKEVEGTDPEFLTPHFYLMVIGLQSHDFRQFLEEGQKDAEIRNDPVLGDIVSSARIAYARSGEGGFFRVLYAKQKEYYAKGQYPNGLFAMTCVAMGKRQEALHLLEVAYARRRPDALWVLTDPYIRTLKGEPGYDELVRKINFPGFSDGSPAAKPATEGARLRASR